MTTKPEIPGEQVLAEVHKTLAWFRSLWDTVPAVTRKTLLDEPHLADKARYMIDEARFALGEVSKKIDETEREIDAADGKPMNERN